MPEKLAIALLVLVAIGWALFKFLAAASRAVRDAREGFLGTVEGMRMRRFEKRKAALAPRVRLFLPDDLDKSERTLKRLSDDFQRRIAKPGLTPTRPTWERKAFIKQQFMPQSEFCSEMNIAEIDSILRPDPASWSQKELALLATDCTYPARTPLGTSEEFHEFVGPVFQIREAVFEFDHRAIREKDVVRYFREEKARVARYNEQRREMLAKHAKLTEQIETWNAEQLARWESYCKASASLLHEEMEKFRLHAEQYRKD
jgi:hypothetical protein